MSDLQMLLNEREIFPKSYISNSNHRLECPVCHGGTTKEKSLALTLDSEGGAVWVCHRATCSFKGNIPSRRNILNFERKSYIYPKEHIERNRALWVDEYFAARKISGETLDNLDIYSTRHFMPELDKEMEVIVFPYRQNGILQRRKYRGVVLNSDTTKPILERVEKVTQAQDKDSPPSLFNFDSINLEKVIWVEGEMDVVALFECGQPSCISLPDGAPKKRTDGKPLELGLRLLPINLVKSKLDQVKMFILAGDMDEVGQALMGAIEDVLGPRRCKFVTWPIGCKDANETLIRYGNEVVNQCIENARFSSKVGILSTDFGGVIERMSEMEIPGLSLGIPDLDKIMKVPAHGGMTLITGQPGRGKTSFTNWMVVKTIMDYRWHWAIFSAEGYGGEGAAISLMKTYAYMQASNFIQPKITEKELNKAFDKIMAHCIFLDTKDQISKRMSKIMETVEWLKTMRPIHGMLIDPVNEVDWSYKRTLARDDEHMNVELSKISNWTHEQELATYLVAHPRTMRKGKDGKVGDIDGYDIAGGAPYYNKPDMGITISRNEEDHMELTCWKARYQNWAKLGKASVLYDWRTGLIVGR